MKFKSNLTILYAVCMFSVSMYGQKFDTNWGNENQYCADLGNGFYLNPILKGNYADPSVLRDGNDYYMTHSSFDNIPGLLIWHSKDLVNWEPFGHALHEYVGSVWAPDLIKYKGTYYIYFPASGTNWVVTAKKPIGPWSKPVDLKIGGIDPGHVIAPDGKRYLYLSSGYVVPLSDDGLRITGSAENVYDGWSYPEDWIVECFCLESPKLTFHNNYYYLTVAEGGTAGPPTSHMVVSARSKTPLGPWENSPYNPIIRNTKRDSKWISTGHGTLVDSPDGNWWIVFHGFENADRTIGRQTLLLPVEWTKDGWFKVPDNVSPDQSVKKPEGEPVPHGIKLSDSFEGNKLNQQWNIINNENPGRFRILNDELLMTCKGENPANSLPLTISPSNNSYEVSVELIADENANGGIILYYGPNYYSGLAIENKTIYRLSGNGGKNEVMDDLDSNHVFFRLCYNHHDLLYYYSFDGRIWNRVDFVIEMSGYHTNTLSDWGYLRPGIYAAGKGIVRFKDFEYKGFD